MILKKLCCKSCGDVVVLIQVAKLSDPVNGLLLRFAGRCARDGVTAFLHVTHANHHDRREFLGYLQCLFFASDSGYRGAVNPCSEAH